MAPQLAVGFLDLPSELRIKIYQAINMMNTVPMDEFIGLYESCRLVQKEMDYECTAKTDRMVADALTPTNLSLSVQLLSRFDLSRMVWVDLDAAILAHDEPPTASDAMPFVRLARLPLESLTVRIANRQDTSSMTQKNILSLICDCCVDFARPLGGDLSPVLVPEIVFRDPSIEPSPHTIIRVGRPRGFKGKGWYILTE
jgi:hypothetical protein